MAKVGKIYVINIFVDMQAYCICGKCLAIRAIDIRPNTLITYIYIYDQSQLLEASSYLPFTNDDCPKHICLKLIQFYLTIFLFINEHTINVIKMLLRILDFGQKAN